MQSRVAPRWGFFSGVSACALALGILVPGCGGGGGGGPQQPNSPLPNPDSVSITATPQATTVGSVCSPTSFTPNYSPARLPTVDEKDYLLKWSGFPIRVFLAPVDDTSRAITVAGFDRWVAASGGRASYQVVGTRTGADLVVTFESIAEDSTLGLTTNFFNPNNATIVRSEIKLDFEKINRISTSSTLKQYVAAHEFGHALGLSLHSSFRADLMFPTVENRTPIPTERDVNTLRTAYCDVFPARSATRIQAAKNGPIKSVTHSLSRNLCVGHSH